ncbi:MAG: biotin/lipoyl-binding protein [Anaerolineales bacterium]|nr:biotin/lipoyl-binding protein [Anaerolineales bacterium]
MPTEVIMPQLGESVVEGTVTKWLKGEGESIEEFEPLLEVNTDKVDTEVPSPASGTVLKVYVEEGQTVRAGTLLAFLGAPGDEVPDATSIEPEVEVGSVVVERKSPQVAEGDTRSIGFISPVVARMASEHNVDLNRVKGTGRRGRITKKDIVAYIEASRTTLAEAPWAEPATGELFRPTEEVFGEKKEPEVSGPIPGTVLPVDIVRRSIADHMVQSRRTSPHVSTVMEADLSQVVAHRQSNKEAFARDGVNLTYTAYLVSAVASGLKAWPIVNSSWKDDGIHVHQRVNIGVAVSLGERGLIVPVIKGADQMSLLGIARSVSDLSERARNHKLDPDDVQEGTFTITNHGVFGSLFATPIINQPQAAILGVGAVQKRVVVVELEDASGVKSDALAIRPMVYLTMTFDHRILDGAVADEFLGVVVSRLEHWKE